MFDELYRLSVGSVIRADDDSRFAERFGKSRSLILFVCPQNAIGTNARLLHLAGDAESSP
jgi:hypothetical protein